MKEEEIRPKEILKRYLDLSAKDGQNLNTAQFIQVCCQACWQDEAVPHITKHNFTYQKCLECKCF